MKLLTVYQLRMKGPRRMVVHRSGWSLKVSVHSPFSSSGAWAFQLPLAPKSWLLTWHQPTYSLRLLPDVRKSGSWESRYAQVSASCLLNRAPTLMYKMPKSPRDSRFQSIQGISIFFKWPTMTTKMLTNTQWSQTESLSYKNHLIMQPALFVYLYSLQDTLLNTVEKTKVEAWDSWMRE